MTDARTIAKHALLKASAYDPRQRAPDLAILEAWAEAITGLTNLQDALDAVAAHYAVADARVMLPGDLAARMRTARAARPVDAAHRLELEAVADRKARAEQDTDGWVGASGDDPGMTRAEAIAQIKRTIGRIGKMPPEPPTRATVTP